jgi:hypothetical protein
MKHSRKYPHGFGATLSKELNLNLCTVCRALNGGSDSLLSRRIRKCAARKLRALKANYYNNE